MLIATLLTLVAFAVRWEWLHSHTPVKVRKHGRRENSLFRYGLDYLRSVINDVDLKHRHFLEFLQFLSCT
ncbi:hypothetical protein FRE64_09835 [Euhalothece natronophila Z-M001]|uniref:IS4 family transposase n=1 Tax=Euhalothece natronophila Z-M001 TaxID=522448 RepID=A0A5B8NNR4_9CHRO|nr:hypothetical protein [Euhalothece natronophila]QDZ40221.1 hypothetical protein FRE64_09835 [Euhalothece natronophila Z-M001]